MKFQNFDATFALVLLSSPLPLIWLSSPPSRVCQYLTRMVPTCVHLLCHLRGRLLLTCCWSGIRSPMIRSGRFVKGPNNSSAGWLSLNPEP
ncbi:hypothetical protein FIBSPDRAFT_533034 [Athelia psychrophila]|uniref:Secreted protein n=1 Tax=Athelia psychrophila TaxID=1759441 RepID=A0A166JA57_9AGAM|nr:hypothetical protein FIBSPDRAFT_533034 [Fibularhizoctonia sp. CBS 109695]